MRPIIHTRGSRKKSKVHKKILEYTITQDNANIVEERVQDSTVEEFEEAKHQTGNIKMIWLTLDKS
jgi:hypothetical protein